MKNDAAAKWTEVPKPCKIANSPQNFWVYPGQVLMACLKEKTHGMVNGAFYTVKSAGARCVLEDCDSEIEVSMEFVATHMRMTHALTYASAQGATLHGTLRLLDTKHKNFKWSHLYVGLSRATSYSLVQVL